MYAVPLTTMHKDRRLAGAHPSVTAGNPHGIRLQDALVPAPPSTVECRACLFYQVTHFWFQRVTVVFATHEITGQSLRIKGAKHADQAAQGKSKRLWGWEGVPV